MGGPPFVGCSSAVAAACRPHYGARGVASAANLPPAQHAGFIFRQSDARGNLWLFGGENGSEVRIARVVHVRIL